VNRRLLREEGSAAAALVFLIVAAIMAGLFVTIAVNLVNVTSASRGNAALHSAADQRFNDYLTGFAATGEGNVEEICYPQTASCATITDVLDTAAGRTIVISAIYGQTQQLEVTRTLKPVTRTHISGFDAAGNPVWVTEPNTTRSFTGFGR
jgi:hypothetical protein